MIHNLCHSAKRILGNIAPDENHDEHLFRLGRLVSEMGGLSPDDDEPEATLCCRIHAISTKGTLEVVIALMPLACVIIQEQGGYLDPVVVGKAMVMLNRSNNEIPVGATGC